MFLFQYFHNSNEVILPRAACPKGLAEMMSDALSSCECPEAIWALVFKLHEVRPMSYCIIKKRKKNKLLSR